MQEFILAGSHFQSDNNILLNHREIAIHEGATMILTKGFAPQGVHLEHHRKLTGHHAGFNFCQKGRQFFSLTGNYMPATAGPKHCNVLVLPEETLSTTLEAGGEFHCVTILISLSRYLSVLGQSVEHLPKNFLTCTERENHCYFKNYDWHPRIRQILGQLQQVTFSPYTEHIFLESKMLEILAIMLERQCDVPDFHLPIGKNEKEKMQYARQLLEKDLANPPSLSKLAKLIGSNEFALKRGFKMVIGMPVYRFIKKSRMEKAAELLLETDLQIGEIAHAVGYENISAFTRAFKQIHQHLPSEVRKTP